MLNQLSHPAAPPWHFKTFLTVNSFSSFVTFSSGNFLLSPVPLSPPSLSALPQLFFLAIDVWLHVCYFFLDLRKLHPLMELEERTELLRTCYKSVLCLPSTEVLQKEASSLQEAQATVVINSLMFVSFYSAFIFERMRSIGLVVTCKALPPYLLKT